MMNLATRTILIGGMWLLADIFVLPVAYSQNPLRRDQSNGLSADSMVRTSEYYSDVRDSDQNTASYGERMADQSYDDRDRNFLNPSAPNRDENVVFSSFEQIPKSKRQAQETAQPRVLGSTIDEGWQDPKRIVDLIMKISLNLVFVLCFAFGVLLIIRRWTKPKLTSTPVERARGDSLSILQTLQLDPRISIRLVQWRSNRFLVACDQNGIQSVNPLNASFDQTLKELDRDDTTDEQLVKQLLAGLEMNKG